MNPKMSVNAGYGLLSARRIYARKEFSSMRFFLRTLNPCLNTMYAGFKKVTENTEKHDII